MTEPAPATPESQQEIDLLRAQLQAMAGLALARIDEGPVAGGDELDLLRALLGDLARHVTGQAASGQSAPVGQAEEVVLLREQLRQVSGLGTPIPGRAEDEETALLRGLVGDLSGLVTGGPSGQPEETALLRGLLGDLARLVTTPATAMPSAAPEELALLREQLRALAGLARPAAPPVEALAPPVLPWAIEEARLLRETLAALLPRLGPASPAPARAPLQGRPVAPGMAEVEAAIAQLLAELVAETDRRLRAEAEAMQARALLRAHGLDDRPTPRLT